NHLRATETYPANPNGSPGGVTGISSLDGRVTIMMPHPERVFRTATNSWHPDDWGQWGPWMRLFRNARRFGDGPVCPSPAAGWGSRPIPPFVTPSSGRRWRIAIDPVAARTPAGLPSMAGRGIAPNHTYHTWRHTPHE